MRTFACMERMERDKAISSSTNRRHRPSGGAITRITRRDALKLALGAAAGVWPRARAAAAKGASSPLHLFAAASTAGAVTAVTDAFAATGAGAVRPVFAASSTLARQIVQGAPADLYLSANVAWMDYLARNGRLEPQTRVDLLGNRLVLVAPAGSSLTMTIAPGFPLAAALDDRPLALADPAHVPAGMYARTALERLGVWAQLVRRTVAAVDVRAALALVERGEAAAAVVYASDACDNPRVRVVATFPTGTHDPIVYPLAIVAGRDGPLVRAFYHFLQGAVARDIFQAHGFLVPERA